MSFHQRPTGLQTIGSDLIGTLSKMAQPAAYKPLPRNYDMSLRDALRIKKERGDTDCDDFKAVAKLLAYGLNACVGSCYKTIRAIADRHIREGSPAAVVARLEAFLSDLDGFQAESA